MADVGIINTEEVFKKIKKTNGVYYRAIFGITLSGEVEVCENDYIRSEYKHIFTVEYYSQNFVPKFLSADNFMETMEKVRENNIYDPDDSDDRRQLVDDLPPLV